ncbi:unnamed protein product [Protopolystoma xenopodis]|uniref:Uncharacterized protein n=1 Tax=Protopolystoma xenopodis TaxID=117903 RepID=A0A448XHE4_9PLAT|nr:unnamed protein product [Protopolystoma xenopodis]
MCQRDNLNSSQMEAAQVANPHSAWQPLQPTIHFREQLCRAEVEVNLEGFHDADRPVHDLDSLLEVNTLSRFPPLSGSP